MRSGANGWALLVLAGVMNGSFALPMKRMAKWQWENVWLLWSALALLVLPLALFIACVPSGWALYVANASALPQVIVCGVAWGIAQVLFGLGVASIGIALTFSLVLGISAALGAAAPFLRFHADLASSKQGAFLFAGLAVLAVGMVFCARAGVLRERLSGRAARAVPIGWGLLIAVVSGVLASAMNIGFTYARPLTQAAAQNGVSSVGIATVAWLPLLAGGAIPNLLYTAYLLGRNGTARLYGIANPLPYFILTSLMALLWFASTVLYGVSSSLLGVLGPVFGWPAFMATVVVVASALGWLAGEWRDSGSRPLRLQWTGLLLLIAAVLLFSKVST